MTTRTITCKNCKQTKPYHAKDLCKTCYKKQWSKEYMQRPEIKEKANANMRRYRTDPKYKKYQERQKKYRQRPEVKQRQKGYEQKPEVKEKKKLYAKKYYQRPGVKERLHANKQRYRTNPKFKHIQEHEKQYRKKYHQRPEVKEKAYQYEQRPERKAYHKKHGKQYRQTPKGKKAIQKQNAYINLIYKPKHGDIELMPDVYPDEIPTTPHHIKNNINNQESELWFYMFIPRITHEYVGGKTRNNGHWYHAGKWIEILYCMNIKNFLEGKNFMTN